MFGGWPCVCDSLFFFVFLFLFFGTGQKKIKRKKKKMKRCVWLGAKICVNHLISDRHSVRLNNHPNHSSLLINLPDFVFFYVLVLIMLTALDPLNIDTLQFLPPPHFEGLCEEGKEIIWPSSRRSGSGSAFPFCLCKRHEMRGRRGRGVVVTCGGRRRGG